MKFTKKNRAGKVVLILLITAGVVASLGVSEPVYSACDYQFLPTGTKGTKGYDYGESGAPTYPDANSGTFNVVTYNVDGFPKCVGGNSNSKFKSLLNVLDSADYDLVLMQEVFAPKKHGFIKDTSRVSESSYPYRSKHWRGGSFSYGDGLLRLSDFPFDMRKRDDDDYSLSTFEYEEYNACHGDLSDGSPDCLTEKGFTVAKMDINDGYTVHVYNTHLDAGRDADDIAARSAQMQQLAAFINAYSANVTVILGGDFNLKWADYPSAAEHEQIWETFLASTGITLACQAINGGVPIVDCDFDDRASVDQIGYANRSSSHTLSVDEYYELTNFTGLSDHEPKFTSFSWVKN